MGLVTLISDFGDKDYYVALLKAAILRHDSSSMMVDVTHSIHRHDIMEASFFCQGVYSRFPLGTIHLVAVNSFYSVDSELIFFEREGHYFVGPNNGVFPLVFPDLDYSQVYKLQSNLDVDNQYELLGMLVSQLAVGQPFDEIGLPVGHLEQKISLLPVITSQQIRATIVHIDQFGNVIVNLDHDTFQKIRQGRDYAIYYKSKDPITSISYGYSDTPIGDVCAFFNTIGFLEIAVNMGNAHELLNLNKNETIQINFL